MDIPFYEETLRPLLSLGLDERAILRDNLEK
jgi:hypothetical protein